MDEIVMTAGTALVGAVATDAWQQAKNALAGLGRALAAEAHAREEVGEPVDARAIGSATARLREALDIFQRIGAGAGGSRTGDSRDHASAS